MMKTRYLNKQVQQDLEKKMVFVGGPRQVGKTTMAKSLISDLAGYINWDTSVGREQILQHQLPNTDLWVFDELHKNPNWRQFLKGVYDQHHDQHQILVTGSAMLDYYRRGGDSLQGRYHYLRMNPLSVAELGITLQDDFTQLFELGGFPEPFFASNYIDAKRWSREYRSRLLQEDLATLESVKDLSKLEMLMLRLPQLVGSPLSINAIRQDLQVSHASVQHWLAIFCRLYSIIMLPPFGAPSIRAVKKEQKHYHYDWTLISEPGLRFENMLAIHLLKWVEFEVDTKARELELRYFRDIDKREVDFIITEAGQPVMAIEAKLHDADISNGLNYFKNKFPDVTAYQLSYNGKKDYVSKTGIRVCPALTLLSTLT